ncbi:hypothetical protein DFA_01620 [Cavenderia fasciculata]|uniref:Uncharacterized protein n=1 Tax=Cavenderia fasciculata TaxID=261658 RepID=F4PTR4_CACFS|nr:uncharacterized protein DFA_01620 [Cavenderia fasciculata]EGG21734.1 hypothetical protein DFA_01620 [Cavenderia fasciculata]|eukprot:XP_004359584.1 hypothetical protein DFA_01620 [Cavenderia fasciculata]
MKFFLLPLFTLCCFSQMVSSQEEITQFFIMNSQNVFYSYNTTSGALITTNDTNSTSKYNFYGQLSSNATDNTVLFLGTDLELNQDCMVQYNINQNSLTTLQCTNAVFNSTMFPQAIAYDPVHNFAAIPSNDTSSNLTIYIWNFNTQELESIPLPTGVMNDVTLTPVGAYDASTGNYYILYTLLSSVHQEAPLVMIYNLLSRKVVQERLSISNAGTAQPQFIFASGRVFFVDIYPMGDQVILEIDLESRQATQAWVIQNGWKTNEGLDFGMTIGQKGNYIVLFSHFKQQFVCTTVSLYPGKVTFTTSPPAQPTDNVIGLEWISGAI